MSRIMEEAAMIRDLMQGHRNTLPEGFRYWSALDLVTKEGIAFEPVVHDKRGPMKQCYKNAGNMALNEPSRYVYVEGFALMSEKLPLTISHAWVYDLQEQRPLEVTWDTPGPEYIGIPFAFDFLRGMVLAREVWGILDCHTMLTEEARPEKYRHPSDLFSLTP